MNAAQTKALKILKEEEKASLSLQLSHSKSTWEAGEILNRSHYKYLEIFERAKKFFKMFTEHYDFYPDFFPPDIVLKQEFKDYLTQVILNRQNLSTSLYKVNSSAFYDKVR